MKPESGETYDGAADSLGTGKNGGPGTLPLMNESGIRAYFDLVRLTPLLKRTCGIPEIKVGLIDGPVVLDHPDLRSEPN
jgi:hypothetical protein